MLRQEERCSTHATKIGAQRLQTAFVREIAHDAGCGHGEAVVAEIFDRHAPDDEKSKEFLFDDGSNHHSSGQKSLIKNLEDIPHESNVRVQ